MVAGGGADPPEERPEWLPEGWTISKRSRKNGRVDRYYMSPSGQTLRSKAEVISYTTKQKATVVELESATQSTIHLNEKQKSESNNLQVLHEDKAFSLPDGWIVETKTRKGGRRSGASYKIYCNPVTGFKCYSLKEVNRYVAASEHSMPVSRAKKSASSNCSNSVPMENKDIIVEQPPQMKNASRAKKDKVPIVAVTSSKSPVRRNSFGSSTLNSSGDKVRDEKVKDVSEDLSLEEVGDIFESIDKIIQNLSQDLKIPDISISYSMHLEQGEFDLVDKTEACHNSKSTVEQSTKKLGAGCSENTTPCELKKVETNSAYLLPRKGRRQTDLHSAATKEESKPYDRSRGKLNGKSYSGLQEVVNETSTDMVSEETDEISNGNLTLSADDKSDRKRKSSKLARNTAPEKQPEPDNANSSLLKNRDGKLEVNTQKVEQTRKNSKRNNNKQPGSNHPFTPEKKDINKITAVSTSSRSSRRLAGLDAGPDAHSDITENAPRKRLRI